jgi:hypothetical protein
MTEPTIHARAGHQGPPRTGVAGARRRDARPGRRATARVGRRAAATRGSGDVLRTSPLSLWGRA